ncbi:MAG: wax ester/triacylglycerol synthase family O-acyltransferase [Solirubrobacterales bacterium]
MNRKRLSPSDMSSLLAERGPIHVNVGATMILEGDPPAFEDLLDHVAERLDLVPRFRQRVTPTPMRIANPEWADDPEFDLRWHVRHAGLPRPGTVDQLREYVGRVMSESLDFARPLWQLYLIEGLEGGRHVVLSKTHHALVDGVAAVDVGTILLDPNPEGTEMPVAEEPSEHDVPSSELLFVRAATERIRRPLRRARHAARSAITMPGETASRVMRTTEAFAELAIGDPVCTPSSFNVEIGRDRRVAFVRGVLQALKDARGDGGATVNDVILSVAAGALARFLAGRGEEVPKYLVALVPVSVWRPDEHLELGNRISTILVRLPLAATDPAERLELVRAETARLKQSEQARASSLIIEATGWTPPTINRLITEAFARQLVFNLVVSNVPGPQVPFYLLGRRLREVYPFVPLSPQHHAISIGVVSYDGGVFFGLAGDRRVVADIDDLAAALAEQTGG